MNPIFVMLTRNPSATDPTGWHNDRFEFRDRSLYQANISLFRGWTLERVTAGTDEILRAVSPDGRSIVVVTLSFEAAA